MFRILLLLTLLSVSVKAQPTELVPFQDLAPHWLTVDRQGEKFIPYVMGNSLNYPMIGIMLNTRTQSGLVLQSCTPKGTAVFVNNRIVTKTGSRSCIYYDIDSLAAVYDQDELFISFFSRNLKPEFLSTQLMSPVPVVAQEVESENRAQILKRVSSSFPDFYMVAILITLGLYAYLINRFPRAYRDFYNFSKAFSPTLKEEKILAQRNMGTANALFLWGHSLMISLVILLFWKILGGIPDLFNFIMLDGFSGALISWLLLAAMVYLTIGLKYLLIRVLCSLLNFSKIAQIHFFDFMRLSMIFVSFTLLVLTLFYFGELNLPELWYRLALYTFLAFLVVRIVVILLKLIGGGTFRKIHLISYLCTTEILPLIIGIRIFF